MSPRSIWFNYFERYLPEYLGSGRYLWGTHFLGDVGQILLKQLLGDMSKGFCINTIWQLLWEKYRKHVLGNIAQKYLWDKTLWGVCGNYFLVDISKEYLYFFSEKSMWSWGQQSCGAYLLKYVFWYLFPRKLAKGSLGRYLAAVFANKIFWELHFLVDISQTCLAKNVLGYPLNKIWKM